MSDEIMVQPVTREMCIKEEASNDILRVLRELACDVNPTEIADHIKHESLENWCKAWRYAFDREIERLEDNP